MTFTYKTLSLLLSTSFISSFAYTADPSCSLNDDPDCDRKRAASSSSCNDLAPPPKKQQTPICSSSSSSVVSDDEGQTSNETISSLESNSPPHTDALSSFLLDDAHLSAFFRPTTLENGEKVVYSTRDGLLKNRVILDNILSTDENLKLILDVSEDVTLDTEGLPKALKHLKLISTTDSIIHIKDNFLKGNKVLQTLDLSSLVNLSTIGDGFLAETKLDSLDFSNLTKLTRIGNDFLRESFIRTLNLSSLSNISHIGSYFLYSCGHLTDLHLPKQSNLRQMEDGFLCECFDLKSIDLSFLSQVTHISNKFINFTKLKTIDLRPLSNVISVGDKFLAETNFLWLDVSPMKNLSSIGEKFLQDTYIVDLNLSSLTELTSIKRSFLSDNYHLTSVLLPNARNLKHIGDHFMSHCPSLLSIDLSPLSNAVSIGSNFLSGCNLLTVDLSPFSKVKSVGENFLVGNELTLADLSSMTNLITMKTGFLSNVPLWSDGLIIPPNAFFGLLYNLNHLPASKHIDSKYLLACIAKNFLDDQSPLTQHIHQWLNSYDRRVLSIVSRFILTFQNSLRLSQNHPLMSMARTRAHDLNQPLDNPKNPWTIRNSLTEKRREVLDLQTFSPTRPFYVGDKTLLFDPHALIRLSQNLSIDAATVPHVTPDMLMDAMNVIRESYTPAVAAHIADITAPHGMINFTALYERANSLHFRNLLNRTSVTPCQLKCLLHFALTRPDGASTSTRPLSSAQEQLIRTLSTIRNCTTGMDGDIAELYQALPSSHRFSLVEGTMEDFTNNEKSKTVLKEIVRSTIETIISTDTQFFKRICATDAVQQLSHQARYVENLIGPELGVDKGLRFDFHTECLYLSLVQMSKKEALQIAYEYLITEGKLMTALKDKINQLTKNSNLYIALSDLTQKWEQVENEDADDLDNMYTLSIKEEGVLELLEALGLLRKSTQ